MQLALITTEHTTPNMWEAHYLVTCFKCKRTWREEQTHETEHHVCWKSHYGYTLNGHKTGPTPYFYGLYKKTKIRATYSEHTKCDARCTTAKGPACNCSCGGQNHGSMCL